MSATRTDPELADELVGTVRDWVRKDVVPVASDYEHEDRFPEPLVAQMRSFGLFGAKVPEAYGGLDLDTVTYARLMEELSYGWMSLAGVLNTHTILVTLLVRHGTEEQRARLLPRLAGGDVRGAFSLSEPDAGSDAAAIRCKATPDGDEYVLDGTKMWVTNGERAGVVALAARAPEGITCFLIEKEPGATFGGIATSRTIGKLGYKGIETVEMSYAGHRVPASSVLGGPEGRGQGLRQVLGALELGRVNIAARAVGVAQAAYDAAMRYAHERETFGVHIHKHQAIQFKLADMATRIEASRLLTRSAAEKVDAGERADVEAGMAKLFASETAFEVATEAMRVHGGYGYTTELPVERYYRDAPLMIIGEGTNEIQRLVIARGLLRRWAEAAR
ncbi:MAG TPA: acyl-CoA dehydrogenase family protein [Acidimicrobiales bacterium]|nr:acyl-CoA dehydrogenase family protein [Acidimicrobiales bacterium]